MDNLRRQTDVKNSFPSLTITTRLLLLLLVFVLTFYGTLVNVFVHIQQMMNISEQIVNINSKISTQSKLLIEQLMEMDDLARKHNLAPGILYQDQFATTQRAFTTGLQSISHLSARGYTAPAVFSLFLEEYTAYSLNVERTQEDNPDAITWVDKNTVSSWLTKLDQFRDNNQADTENSLLRIHNLAQKATRNGLLGLVLSICISLMGIWYIAGSIITPLRQLTRGLRNLPHGGQATIINISAPHEFQDLATAYNEMHVELQEQESLRADFIAALSHEIRTPLTSIQESVNMLTEEVLGEINEKQRKFLTISSHELARITGLLNQLMDVSMLTSPNYEQKIARQIDPRRMVLNCVAALSAFSAQNNITIVERCQPNCGVIQGRPEEFQQVLINILGNAIKFSPGGSEIIVQVVKNEKKEQVVFKISDQGPGISESEYSLIFKKYYRSTSVRKHMSGVGLGLYISSRIIHSMGGTIEVENNPGIGCTFSISVPSA